ncbi:hypothetical protein FDV58_39785 [Bradyrhizobium elkanii]|uniref:Uncharacterized protein n=1 Tax=Bradyrhizobium elkanii TaxID=29448 RepID=A0A4U6REL7_BRAEL|nr:MULTISPECIES: hypothetical protein [Bradyrhizobium]MTV11757.1 hypothetical protein [Bradyrhizobium sp. BR2003]TKV71602.1 hypothetical protein FDV58_39785 [Bradyrhizobium elkanii]
MARKPNPDFGKRRPVVPAVPTPPRPDAPSKRSNQVALLLMGTLAVGGSAYALMPRPNCQPVPPPPGVTAPGVATPVPPQPGVDCTARSSSSGSGGSSGSARSSFFNSSSSSSGSSASSSSSSSSSVNRGGFGSFAHAFGFSGG